MQGLKVQCPNCKRVMFETTDKYDPNVTPNGSMVKSLAPYQIDWLTSSTTLAAEMTCPECLAQLAPKGRLMVLPLESEIPPYLMEGAQAEIPDEVSAETVVDDSTSFACPVCGKEFSEERKMKGHLGGAHRKRMD